MGRPPEGTVTFLFTDIVGSTRLWQEQPEAMAAALERHDGLARERFERRHGHVFATGGDGFAVVFGRASDAVAAARELQDDLAIEPWPDGVRLQVRTALHTGEAVERDGDYFGPAVNTAARLLAAGHPGQVLLTDATRAVLDDGVSLSDLGPHRLRDIAAPVRVWQVGDAAFGELRSLRAVTGNLPRSSSELIGRDDDIQEVIACLATSRLVTLTGVGGVGKTRLALGVAAAAQGSYPDGCWLVDLAIREAGDDLAAAVARSLGAHGAEAHPELLFEHLRDRRMLLVLDNCEHLIDGAAELLEALLERTTELEVLATSREPLGLDGEQVVRVRSLAVADGASAASGSRSPAAALFFARAAECGGRVEDDDASHAAVVDICRQLDGIPLAIELAAARTRGLTAPEILDRLSERFRLLGGGRRSQERHRTLLAAVKWSHDLLQPGEQVVWRRLSTFVGGFDLAAAERVAAEPDTVDAVLSLVDKSMLQADGTSSTRYSMLETLRQYASDQLADAGEVEAITARHADHYLGLVTSPLGELRGPREQANRQVLEPERDNVLSAAQHLVELGEHDRLADVLRRSWFFWEILAPAEGARLCEVCIPHVEPRVAASLVGRASFLSWIKGDPEQATRLGREHVQRCEELGVPPEVGGYLGLAIAGSFDPQLLVDGRSWVEAGVEAAHRETDPVLRTMMFSTSMCMRSLLGDPGWVEDRARAEADLALTGSDHTALTVAVTTAAAELYEAGRGPAAAAERLAADRHLVEQADPTISCWYHWMCGRVALDGDPEVAAAHFQASVHAADRFGATLMRNLGLEGVALSLAIVGRLEDAATLRGATRPYFDDQGVTRGWQAEGVRDRLDDLLHRQLEPERQARAEAAGRALPVAALVTLALEDAPAAGHRADA